MVRASTMMAGLALAVTTYATPLPQNGAATTSAATDAAPAETPAVDESLPEVDSGAGASNAGLPGVISLGAATDSAAAASCAHDPNDPKSWADSGAEQMVVDYLKANGGST